MSVRCCGGQVVGLGRSERRQDAPSMRGEVGFLAVGNCQRFNRFLTISDGFCPDFIRVLFFVDLLLRETATCATFQAVSLRSFAFTTLRALLTPQPS